MRIAYVNHGRFPTEKAHGFQVAQVCDALVELGHEVTLLCPSFRNEEMFSAKEYYGLRHDLHVEHLPHFDAFQSPFIPGILGFSVSMRSYGRAVRTRAASQRYGLLYLRSPLLLRSALATGVPVIIELHALPRYGRTRFVRRCNRCHAVVCLTSPMRDVLRSWGVADHLLRVEADGVDLRRFEGLPSIDEAKRDWQLPDDAPVVGYVGSLVTMEKIEKGIADLLAAAVLLKQRGISFLLWIVGGPPAWVQLYEAAAHRHGLTESEVKFQGHIPAARVPSAIAACEVCVYPAPNTDHPYFQRDTSPLKLFEYLAAGKPVVCANIPPVRDVVTSQHVQFCAPGDARSLAEAIIHLLVDAKDARTKGEEGRSIARRHGWESRMQRILSSLIP